MGYVWIQDQDYYYITNIETLSDTDGIKSFVNFSKWPQSEGSTFSYIFFGIKKSINIYVFSVIKSKMAELNVIYLVMILPS